MIVRLFLPLLTAGLLAAQIKSIGQGPLKGSAQAVVVTSRHLAHTAQFVGNDPAAVLSQADQALRQAGSSLSRAVKLNIVVAGADVTAKVEQVLAERYPDASKAPAVSLVAGSLPGAGAAFAVDVVAITARTAKRNPQVAVLPAGPRAYISGQSANGTLEKATRETLDKLKANLAFLGLSLSDVIQVKSFVDPIASVPDVRRSIDEYFGPQPPPQVFVEWTSKGRIEIELIAAIPSKATPASLIEHLWPPEEKPSPVFCRMVRLASPTTIYTSGLFGSEGPADKQIRDIFASLDAILRQTSGDLRHLAKATYYVADDEASRKLNDIRPEFYDPKHPPAASKAGVKATGLPGRTVTLDIIAVPVR
ncbi:MAG: RidA family protein [Bryobacterales bacterium]|nr:RidA family protein [Bryobacterales bacterium]